MSKLKIFVSYKYKKPLLENEIVTPIQTGRAIADEIFEDMIGDDTGDNISKENMRYNELTAQYWVWKHYEEIGDPEYVGFMHYRRQFIFDKSLKHTPFTWFAHTKYFYVPKIYKNYMRHFTPEKIYPHLEDNPDCIAFSLVRLYPYFRSHNMREHFYKNLLDQDAEFFDEFEKTVKTVYPDYSQTFDEFKNGNKMYCCNSFIMPKKLFFEYSEFLFNILKKVDERIDSTDFSTTKLRFLGYFGEYLLTVFLFHKSKTEGFYIKELPATFVSKDYKGLLKRFIRYNLAVAFTFGKTKSKYIRKLAQICARMDFAK